MPKLNVSAVAARAKKIDVAEVQAAAALITGGLAAADHMWKSANADQRVTKAVRKAFDGVAGKATPRTSSQKMEQKLAAIETYAAKSQDADEAEAWLLTVKEARNRLPVIEALSGRVRAQALKSLHHELDEILKDIATRDVGTNLT